MDTNNAARNASERGAALRQSATHPVADLSVPAIDHVDLADADVVDFGTDVAAFDPLVPNVGEPVEVDPHAAFLQTHQLNEANEPGTYVTFVWPIRNGAGLDQGKRVFMRRPRIIDQLRVQQSRKRDGSRLEQAEQEVALFALLCGILGEEVASLYDFDYRTLQHAYVGFTELPPRQS